MTRQGVTGRPTVSKNPSATTSRGQMTDELLTQQQLAEELKVSLRTLERWRQQGTGPAYIRVGRFPRYQRSDVNTWLDQQRRTGGTQGAGRRP
jgi:excisionase family DNA binding protein